MALILSIVSGKGGVGKSVIAVNLAEVLAADGRTVALVDADLGQTACATLLNESPATSADFAPKDRRACWHACSSGVTLVQGAAEPPPHDAGRRLVLRALDVQIEALEEVHDFILIDAPAGAEDVARWAMERADLSVLVLVDEPTSVADAYRLVKAAWHADAGHAIGTVVNFAETEAHGRDVWHRFGLITRRFTGNGSFYLGSVPFSTDVRRSVARQVPFVREHESLAGSLRAIAAAAESHAEHARHGISLQ
ncbi:MAG TPA: P-loop NTPase [Rhodothermales bacterium]